MELFLKTLLQILSFKGSSVSEVGQILFQDSHFPWQCIHLVLIILQWQDLCVCVCVCEGKRDQEKMKQIFCDNFFLSHFPFQYTDNNI